MNRFGAGRCCGCGGGTICFVDECSRVMSLVGSQVSGHPLVIDANTPLPFQIRRNFRNITVTQNSVGQVLSDQNGAIKQVVCDCVPNTKEPCVSWDFGVLGGSPPANQSGTVSDSQRQSQSNWLYANSQGRSVRINMSLTSAADVLLTRQDQTRPGVFATGNLGFYETRSEDSLLAIVAGFQSNSSLRTGADADLNLVPFNDFSFGGDPITYRAVTDYSLSLTRVITSDLTTCTSTDVVTWAVSVDTAVGVIAFNGTEQRTLPLTCPATLVAQTLASIRFSESSRSFIPGIGFAYDQHVENPSGNWSITSQLLPDPDRVPYCQADSSGAEGGL